MRPSNKAVTTLPMLRSDGWVSVAFSINREEHEAVLDTGAKVDIVIPKDEAHRLGLIDGTEQNLNPSGKYICWIKKNVTFRVGPKTYQAKSTLALNTDYLKGQPGLKPINYLLGLDFLLQHKVEFDFKTRGVRLYSLETTNPSRYKKAGKIPFHLKNQVLLVEAELSSHKGWFVWDTGSPATYLFKDAFEAIYPDQKDRMVWLNSQEAAIGVDRQGAPCIIEIIKMGDLMLTTPMVSVVDMPEMQKAMEESEGTKLLGLLGADIFGSSQILIDPQESCVWRLAVKQSKTKSEDWQFLIEPRLAATS